VAKLFLILAGIAVAGVLLIGAGAWYWWDRHSGELIEAAKVAVADGQKSGRRLEEAACVVLALERHKADWNRSMASTVRNGLWLNGCLDTASPQQRFCEGVPPADSPVAIGVWAGSSCVQHGYSDPYCQTLFQNISKYCSSPKRAEKLRNISPDRRAT
jgi:hypothetical protein